ncbi:hypothetical protein GCM10017044_05910 [Kordiimonas sediminis]|uniref:Tyr recombinase domain-containing protein n=1 Tax=Kordiimonas sediminis TaxID=1735581 RepID=A0A919ANN8_9PROT|nr:site-specific integrase [Kordiimonas sediminis]GHF14630.1 hypothetical protein GCM10017044_05910 [Kordiimonas sediminis]
MAEKQYLKRSTNGKIVYRRRYPTGLSGFTVGESFKRSTGTDDMQRAERKALLIAQEYYDKVDQARHAKAQAEANQPVDLTPEHISMLAGKWAHDSADLYQMNVKPLGHSEAQHSAFLADIQKSLDSKYSCLGRNDYSTVKPIINGLLRRNGFKVSPDTDTYYRLSQTILRAWIAREEEVVARLKGSFKAPEDTILTELLATQQTIQAASASVDTASGTTTKTTLGKAIQQYKDDHKDNWTKSTVNSVNAALDFLVFAFGESQPVAEITGQMAREVFGLLQGLPQNRKKLKVLRGLTLAECVETAEELNLPTLASATVNKSYLSTIKPFFDMCVSDGLIRFNPFKNRSDNRGFGGDPREPFTAADLQTLFKQAPWSTPSSLPEKPSYFWAPLIALFQGFRRSEACGIRVTDIKDLDGTPSITFEADEGEDRRFKTKNRKQPVPVHPELIRMGFLKFAAKQRAAGEIMLFPESKQDANGKYGDYLSDWFMPHLEAIGIKRNGLKFHSFRHTFQDALRHAGLHGTAEAQALGGRAADYRAANLNADDVADTYGSGFKTSYLLPHLAKVQYPDIDLSHLYIAD